jgi:hypothetical protein
LPSPYTIPSTQTEEKGKEESKTLDPLIPKPRTRSDGRDGLKVAPTIGFRVQKTSVCGGWKSTQVSVPGKELTEGSAGRFLAGTVGFREARYSTKWIASEWAVIRRQTCPPRENQAHVSQYCDVRPDARSSNSKFVGESPVIR